MTASDRPTVPYVAPDAQEEDEHPGILPPALSDYDAAEYLRRLRLAEGCGS